MPLASIEAGDLCKVWEIKTLGKARQGEARSLLERISKQVQPIMRKRKWRVILLSEFCPANPSLLGLNIGGGEEIRIRLRRPNREVEFFPYEELLGTMLHELTHNQHGPHDANFYKLLDEITKECEALMVNGLSGTGQGFDGPGKRLGGYSHNPTVNSMRQAAVAAAERRARAGSLMPTGPHRLGGDSVIMRALSPVQAAAMAAERRLRDDLWCGAPETSGRDGLQRAKEREVGVAGTNVFSGENSSKLDGGTGGEVNFKGKATASHATAITNSASSSSGLYPQKENNQTGSPNGENEGARMWDCHVCTLVNPSLALACGACMTWRREKAKMWTCNFCTLENPVLLDNCAACNQWRYSSGAPVTARTPYIGT